MDRYAVLQRLTDAQNALLGVAAGAIEALRGQLFSRQLPEARSGSKINC